MDKVKENYAQTNGLHEVGNRRGDGQMLQTSNKGEKNKERQQADEVRLGAVLITRTRDFREKLKVKNMVIDNSGIGSPYLAQILGDKE